MKFFTSIVLSTWIALIVATLTEGLDGTYQIRHPTTNDDLVANDKRQLFSPLTTLTTLFGRAKCRIELRVCQKASKGQTPDFDGWEARASQLSASGGNDSRSKLVQMLQDVIVKAREVDMTAITQALKTPNFDPADKNALLAEAKTIRSEARALLKTSSALTVEGIPDWIEKTQAVLNATSALTEKVYRLPNPILIGLLSPFIILFGVIFFIPAVYFWLISVFCCYPCDPVCFVLAIVFTPAMIVGMILFFVGFVIFQIVKYIEGLIPGQQQQQQRWSTRSGDTCFDDLLTCQYDRLLISIMSPSLDLIEKRG